MASCVAGLNRPLGTFTFNVFSLRANVEYDMPGSFANCLRCRKRTKLITGVYRLCKAKHFDPCSASERSSFFARIMHFCRFGLPPGAGCARRTEEPFVCKGGHECPPLRIASSWHSCKTITFLSIPNNHATGLRRDDVFIVTHRIWTRIKKMKHK